MRLGWPFRPPAPPAPVVACLACLVQVALLDEMRENGINPDQYSYNSAIYGCVKAQQSQQMTMVLARMR